MEQFPVVWGVKRTQLRKWKRKFYPAATAPTLRGIPAACRIAGICRYPPDCSTWNNFRRLVRISREHSQKRETQFCSPSATTPRASCEQFQQLAGLWNLRDCSTWNNFQRLLWRSDGEGRLSAIYFGRLEGLRDQPSPTELFHVEQFPIIWPVQPVAGSPKIKSAYDPKVTSARQPSPRTAYEPENRVSRSSSKEISGNFVVIESSYPCKHWP